MDQRRNIEIVRRFYEAGPSDDDSARHDFFTDDAVWHVPGSNHVSGPYRGIAAITGTMVERMRPLDEWAIEVRDVMANEDMVVATVGLTASRKGVRIATDGAHVFRMDDEGRITEAWGFVLDQAGLDRLLDA